MTTSTITPNGVVAPATEFTSEAYANMKAAITAHVMDNQAAPTFKGVDLTKDEKTSLRSYQKDLVKGLSDADRKAYKERVAKAKADAKAESGPKPVRVDGQTLKEASDILNALSAEAAKGRNGSPTITIGQEKVKVSEAIALVAKTVADMLANPVKTAKVLTPTEAQPHTLIRLAKLGGDPFNYGIFDNKVAADKAAKLYLKRMQGLGPDMVANFEFVVLSVEEAKKKGYTIAEKAPAAAAA